MKPAAVAPLLFGSGLCALIYQVAWLREFRLVFGASTAASAAVLAIFIGGLGAGGLILGAVADRQAVPLLLYARLEGGIAVSAAASPILLWLVRAAYTALGGTETLGLAGGTVLRLVLAAVVLGVPTVLMGGTLPAASRAVETERDRARRAVALLYGVNTLGAVTGSFVATFFLLEAAGTRGTLWLASVLNLAVAAVAALAARRLAPAEIGERVAPPEPAEIGERVAPPAFVLAASALVGFAFFLMELVWYRMLGPLLGGSIFTFGLILTVALLGIGLGGVAYSLFGESRPATLLGFAHTCLLEAAAIALPYALGDRVALLALLLRPLGGLGFWGQVLGWTGVTALVVLPTAFVAGVQFPMLIALLGRGRQRVGREVGLAYASNTVGAIAGSLAGGFGLMPLLTAPGCWTLVAAALLVLGLAALALDRRRGAPGLAPAVPLGIAAAVALMLLAPGPSAAWRHSGIGAGRASVQLFPGASAVRNWLHQERRALRWQTEGVESSVALQTRVLGLAFVINGKIDGNATLDAPTQVMSGLLGCALHGRPRTALVIGLGTGSTAGWMGVVPGMERVDVVELERGILQVARACAPVNQSVLDNPRVHVRIGDAREVLLTTRRRYDLVFSEPSNPYRSGIASLFTREYYQAVADRLEPDGVFVQWVQAYEVDSPTVRTIYATLASVFPEIEAWRTHRDLLLVASRQRAARPTAALRERIAQEPYRSGLLHAWRVTDLEGTLARYVAGPSLARAAASREGGALNTDDRNRVEFGFARTVGRQGLFSMAELRNIAHAWKDDRPALADGAVDWSRVEDERLRLYGIEAGSPVEATPDQQRRAVAWLSYLRGDAGGALAAWRAQSTEPSGPNELAMLAEVLAEAGDESALAYIDRLRALEPAEADSALGRLRLRQGRLPEATAAIEAAFVRHRVDPWPSTDVMQRAFKAAEEIAARDPAAGERLFRALSVPFAALSLDEERATTALDIAMALRPGPICVDALRHFEPHVPWRRDVLEFRSQCYAFTRHPKADDAARDLQAFLAAEPAPFAAGLPAAP